jgi:phosphate transport system substrate-binding protein
MKRVACACLVFLAGLSLGFPAKEMPANLSGTISLSGAWALYPMAVKWGEEFRKLHPNLRIDISAGGAGKGIADVLSGAVDIGMVSREINPAEIAKGAWFVPVCRDAVVPTVNAALPSLALLLKRGLKQSDFKAMWIDASVLDWKTVLPGSVSAPLHVYTRSDSCGAAETWALFLGGKQEDLQGVGVYGDPGIAEAVRKDALGIGFNNVNYAFDAATQKVVAGLQVVPIDRNNNGRIDKEENFYSDRNQLIRAIADGRYPAPPARDLYFVCRGKPASPALAAFIAWVLKEGQAFAGETGYIGLSAQKLDVGLKKLGK